MEAEWGSRLALGSLLELSLHPVSPLCQIWLQKSQKIGHSSLDHSQSWCRPQGQGLGLGPSMPGPPLSSSSTPHPGRLGTGSGAQGRLGCPFGLPFLQNPLSPIIPRQWGRAGRGAGGAVTRAHTGAVCSQAGPAPPSLSFPNCELGR